MRLFPQTAEWEITANGAIALAPILGCLGILAHSFFDFNLQIPANAAPFYVLATLGAAKPVPESVRRKKSNSLLIEEVWATQPSDKNPACSALLNGDSH